MLILSKKLWNTDHIIKLHCSNNWDASDTSIICDCVFLEIKKLIIEAKNSGKPAYIICDCTKGELPTFSIAIKFAKSMSSIHDILKDGLVCTILYIKSETVKVWFDRILSVYTPVRPIYIVDDKSAIKQHINKPITA